MKTFICALAAVIALSGCAGRITGLASGLQGNPAAEKAHENCLSEANQNANKVSTARSIGGGAFAGLPLAVLTFGGSLLVGAIAGVVDGSAHSDRVQRATYTDCMRKHGFPPSPDAPAPTEPSAALSQ